MTNSILNIYYIPSEYELVEWYNDSNEFYRNHGIGHFPLQRNLTEMLSFFHINSRLTMEEIAVPEYSTEDFAWVHQHISAYKRLCTMVIEKSKGGFSLIHNPTTEMLTLYKMLYEI